jgi:hypothetical protein
VTTESDAAAASGDPSSSWHLGSRVERVRSSHSYGIVLGLVFALFVFAAAAPDAAWSGSVLLFLQGGTLVIALYTSGVARTDSKISMALLALSAAVGVAELLWAGKALTSAGGLLTAAMTVATAVAIAVGVADQSEVNGRSVLGAISVYILLGLLFVFLYGVVAALGSGPFFAQGTDGTRALRLYFSYVTLATVGYGDYTASGNLGHTLAVIEALVGQLYLVTIVAVLVSRLARRHSS